MAMTLSQVPASLVMVTLCSMSPDRARLAAIAACASWVEMSDFLDGRLARRWGVATRLGAVVDSACDFVARTLGLVGLVSLGMLPAVALAPSVARDGLLWGGRAVGTVGPNAAGPFVRKSGKISGFVHGSVIVTLTWFALIRASVEIPLGLMGVMSALICLSSTLAALDYANHLRVAERTGGAAS